VTQTVPTNDAGCAFFGNINSGNYTVTYSKTGWVDPNGVNAVSFTSSVTSGSTNVVTKNYAQAGTINVTVNTKVNGVTQLSPTTAVTVANASLPAGILTFPASGSTKTISNLYPFTSGYGVWAGSCSSGNPVNNGQASVPIGNPGPGGSANVTVIEPAINATVTGFAIPSGTRFVATSIASGCTERLTATFNSSGKLPDPGFPYGTYKLCADNSSYGVYGDLASFASNDPNGKNAALTYRGNGSCP
jgi:hypothetical protein